MKGPIYPGNDFVEIVGPIKGIDPDTGELEVYHGTGVVARLTLEPDSDVPIGTLEFPSSEMGTTGKYPVFFDGASLETDLAALPDRTMVYRVITAEGDFRVVDPFLVLKNRPSD